MADRQRTGDDDEAPRLPEVTTPPWLRTGPTPDTPHPGLPGAGVSSPGGARKGRDRSGSEHADPGRGGAERAGSDDAVWEAPSTRITLDAHRAGEDASPSPSPPTPTQAPAPGREPGAEEARDPADELSTLPLGTASTDVGRPAPPLATVSTPSRRPARIAVLAVSAVAVLGGSGVLGYVVARGAADPAAQATTECAEVSEPGRTVGAGPGTFDSPAGAVLAFDHAYYVERSAAKAFEAVSPSSRMTQEQLRADGVDQVAEGTTHCVEVREISPTLLDVDLTEYPPDADPVHIRQRVRVAQDAAGAWGIVSITPAG